MTDSTIVRPYGDMTGDGMVQVSFTLPVPCDKRAEGAALQLAGYVVMQFIHDDIALHPDAVVADMKGALAHFGHIC